jgi:hypothetical protein
MPDPIIVENLATLPQTGWIFVGMPAADLPQQEAGWMLDGVHRLPWIRETHGVRIWASLPGSTGNVPTRRKLEWGEQTKPEPFAYHPAITRDVLGILPRYELAGIAGVQPPNALELVYASEAAQVWRHRTIWPARRVTVEAFYTLTAQHPTIEFALHAIYGTTANNGQPQIVDDLGDLRMLSRAQIHVDFARRNGHAAATWSQTTCTQEIVAPGVIWHRASRFELRGALCTTYDTARLEGRPMQGIYTGWANDWLALGKIPQRTADLDQIRRQQLAAYLTPAPGRYVDQRPRAQPRSSGTTGDQPDFGASSDLGVVTLDPWELHDSLWHCQSFAQRPTGNREPDGSPMRADLHPLARTMQQRPDLGLGREDRLGWPPPNQILWIPSPATCEWTTSDDQHRSDLLLHAAYALTRDPALGAIIRDHVEIDRTDYYVRERLVPSPRAVGRLALSRACQVWLGFADALPTLQAGIDDAIEKTALSTLPADRTVRTVGGREQAKYGWADSQTGQPVIGWQPWQEAIAAIGMMAAARAAAKPATQAWSSRAENYAYLVARTVVQQGWRIEAGRWWHAYAVSWNDGRAWTARSDWPATLNSYGEGNTNAVYVSGACTPWTLAASQLRRAFDELAVEQLNAAGAPRSISEARWRAV